MSEGEKPPENEKDSSIQLEKQEDHPPVPDDHLQTVGADSAGEGEDHFESADDDEDTGNKEKITDVTNEGKEDTNESAIAENLSESERNPVNEEKPPSAKDDEKEAPIESECVEKSPENEQEAVQEQETPEQGQEIKDGAGSVCSETDVDRLEKRLVDEDGRKENIGKEDAEKRDNDQENDNKGDDDQEADNKWDDDDQEDDKGDDDQEDDNRGDDDKKDVGNVDGNKGADSGNDEREEESGDLSDHEEKTRRREKATDHHEDQTREDEEDQQAKSDDEEREPEETDEEFSDDQDVPSSGPIKPAEKEDRQNPAFVPRRGNFFQHDDREGDSEEKERAERQSRKKAMMEKAGRWKHDKFDEYEQTPKSRNELINNYGYDIRNESRAPRDPHGRRYGRNQNTERDWRNPDSYGRRSFGGNRRSFGAGGVGRGRGRGGGRRQGQVRPQGSRSVSAGRRKTLEEDHQEQEEEEKNRPFDAAEVARSRSLSEGERWAEKGTANYPHRGRGSGNRNQRGTYGTVEFRRRGRGMAFSSGYGDGYSGRGRNYANDRGHQGSQKWERDDPDRHTYNDAPREHYRQGPPKFSQQHQQQYQAPPRFKQTPPSHKTGRPTYPVSDASSNRRFDDTGFNESIDSSMSSHDHQRVMNQAHPNTAGSTKRYSASRQHGHQQTPPGATSTPVQNVVNPVQQRMPPSGQIPMQKGPPPLMRENAPVAVLASPPIDHPPPYPGAVPYPAYYNGSGMYHPGPPVSVPDVYPIATSFADGNSTYVLQTHGHGQAPPVPAPQRFMGQQHYAAPIYPMPSYPADAGDTYVATGGQAGGTGGTVYFDTQRQQQSAAADAKKRRDKSIPIVAPEATGMVEKTAVE